MLKVCCESLNPGKYRFKKQSSKNLNVYFISDTDEESSDLTDTEDIVHKWGEVNLDGATQVQEATNRLAL